MSSAGLTAMWVGDGLEVFALMLVVSLTSTECSWVPGVVYIGISVTAAVAPPLASIETG